MPVRLQKWSQKGNGLPMVGTQQARFLVLVTDWTEVAPNYFEIGILSNIVFSHLEHAQMKICDWAERATSYQNDRGLLGMDYARKTMMGKRIVGWIREISRGRRGIHVGRQCGQRVILIGEIYSTYTNLSHNPGHTAATFGFIGLRHHWHSTRNAQH